MNCIQVEARTHSCGYILNCNKQYGCTMFCFPEMRFVLYCYAPIGTSPVFQKAFIWNLPLRDRLFALGNRPKEWDDYSCKFGWDYFLYALLSEVLCTPGLV